MIVRTEDQRAGITESCRRLGVVLEELAKAVKPGVTTQELEDLSTSLIRKGGDEPAFLGYSPEGADRPFPAGLCLSVNDEVVHGIPNEKTRVLKEGDIVSLDLGINHKGYISDSAITVPVGKVSKEAYHLMDVTRLALENAILAARPGNRTGDISNAIEKTFEGTGISVVKILGGHGVGEHVHEDPYIANAGRPGTGPEIEVGMVLALEPIANAGKAGVTIAPDGYTYRTRDGSLSAHFEHTILVNENETIVLTRRPNE